MSKSISFLGCGWLGEPLALLLKKNGWSIKASTTTPEKSEHFKKIGFEPFVFTLPAAIPQGFLDSSVLFINIPPGIRKKGNDYHREQIKSICEEIDFEKFDQVIYVNSTALYNSSKSVQTEQEANPNHILFETEQKLKAKLPSICILRAAGLVGKDRSIVNMLTGRSLNNGQLPTNLIFKDDIVAICKLVIEKGITTETINCVCDAHPTKKSLYTYWSERLKVIPPSYTQGEEEGKIISNQYLKDLLGYSFIYPDPMAFPIED